MTSAETKQLNTRFDGLSSRQDELSSKFGELNSGFKGLNSKMDEFMTFVGEQFSKLPTREEMHEAINGAVNGAVNSLRSEMHGEFAKVRSEMVTKSEFYQEINPIKADLKEIKETVHRLDIRTDEDVRAVIKDVAKIKTYLSNKGHQI